ncbi:helix-turn-helix domain-containing protein [Zwartia sp.]|uniref:helix-turn-helix domain-containing protein n=1 Tax=Zwartia sp. TaxID=2978004 RepID=UPI003BAFBE9F
MKKTEVKASPRISAKEPLLSTIEAAQILHLHPQSLHNDRSKQRRIPFLKIGRKVFYRQSDIEAYLASGFVGAPLVPLT